mgnify:FL=1
MTKHSEEICAICGEPIVEGDVQYRMAGAVKVLSPDGTEQPGTL